MKIYINNPKIMNLNLKLYIIQKIDMKTWKKKDFYKDLHEIGITCLTYYHPLEYLITGGKDGKSK